MSTDGGFTPYSKDRLHPPYDRDQIKKILELSPETGRFILLDGKNQSGYKPTGGKSENGKSKTKMVGPKTPIWFLPGGEGIYYWKKHIPSHQEVLSHLFDHQGLIGWQPSSFGCGGADIDINISDQDRESGWDQYREIISILDQNNLRYIAQIPSMSSYDRENNFNPAYPKLHLPFHLTQSQLDRYGSNKKLSINLIQQPNPQVMIDRRCDDGYLLLYPGFEAQFICTLETVKQDNNGQCGQPLSEDSPYKTNIDFLFGSFASPPVKAKPTTTLADAVKASDNAQDVTVDTKPKLITPITVSSPVSDGRGDDQARNFERVASEQKLEIVRINEGYEPDEVIDPKSQGSGSIKITDIIGTRHDLCKYELVNVCRSLMPHQINKQDPMFCDAVGKLKSQYLEYDLPEPEIDKLISWVVDVAPRPWTLIAELSPHEMVALFIHESQYRFQYVKALDKAIIDGKPISENGMDAYYSRAWKMYKRRSKSGGVSLPPGIRSMKAFLSGMRALCDQVEHNPLLDWFNSCPKWTGTTEEAWAFLDTWIYEVLREKDGERTIFGKFMSSRIPLIIYLKQKYPGICTRYIFVLIGEKKIGKSKFIEHLIPYEHNGFRLRDAYYGEEGNLYASKAKLKDKILGKGPIEIVEMEGMTRKATGWLKGHITQTKITDRLAYDRRKSDLPLTQCYIGTSNHEECLPYGDEATAARFIPIKLERMPQDPSTNNMVGDRMDDGLMDKVGSAVVHVAGSYSRRESVNLIESLPNNIEEKNDERIGGFCYDPNVINVERVEAFLLSLPPYDWGFNSDGSYVESQAIPSFRKGAWKMKDGRQLYTQSQIAKSITGFGNLASDTKGKILREVGLEQATKYHSRSDIEDKKSKTKTRGWVWTDEGMERAKLKIEDAMDHFDRH